MPDIREAVDKIYAMISSGNMTGIEDYVAADMVDHEQMPGISGSGLERLQQFIAMFHSAFSDLKMTTEDVVIDGDRAAIRMSISGRHTGDAMGFPATGKSVNVEGIDILRFANGKCVEHWGISDQVGMMTQLGLIPGPGQ